MDYSKHFQDMLKERSIEITWVERTLKNPETVEKQKDGTIHYLRQIPENGDRWLRVIVNVSVTPNKAITTFFDRRLRRQQ